MSRAQFTRLFLVFAVLAVLPILPAEAAPRVADVGQPAGFSASFGQIWRLLTSFWGKNGCGIDPNGNCAAQGGSPVENGCGIDPHGISTPSQSTAQGENGCGLDPNGAH